MAEHNPSEHAEAHGVHTQDLKPDHKTTVHKHEASATPAVEQEDDPHGAHDRENHSHGGLGPKPKPPTSGPKGTKPEAGNQNEHDPESESDKTSGHSNEYHGGSEHTADKRELGKLRGKPASNIIKGSGGGASSGRPGGPKG